MPSTENVTLQRIQREISDVIAREKELKVSHMQNGNNEHETNNNAIVTNNNVIKVQGPAKSSSKPVKTPVLNGSNSNGTRLFTPNPSTKGVMHKFIKSRGKLTTVTGFQTNPLQIKQQQQTWSIPETIEPPKVTEPGKLVRRGYVPVEVRMRKEFEDLHNRERELRLERRKSQDDLSDDDYETPQLGGTLKVARSMAQLYDPDEYRNEFDSSPGMKAARSLAELCDASEDDLETPGSHSLIMRWEEMIQKNQQDQS